jgi:hypothetical protein
MEKIPPSKILLINDYIIQRDKESLRQLMKEYDIGEFKEMILNKFCFLGDLEFVKELIEKYNCNYKNRKNTPLYEAATGLNEDIIVYLLTLGCDNTDWVKTHKNGYMYKLNVDGIKNKLDMLKF